MAFKVECDGIDCTNQTDADHPTVGWLHVEVLQKIVAGQQKQGPWQFCSWHCLSKKAYCMESGDNCK